MKAVEAKFSTQIKKFTERVEVCRASSETIEKIENDYAQVVNYIDENPDINVLKKITDIENFINNAIENLNKTKAFKVHDLSITEKVRPLSAFLYGNDGNQKGFTYNSDGDKHKQALSTSLSGKIMTALNKNRAKKGNNIPKIRSKFPHSNFKESPSFLRSKQGKKVSQTPMRSRIPTHQSSLSYSHGGPEDLRITNKYRHR